MIAAIFDFDGTLVSVPVWKRLVRRQLIQGVNRLPVLTYTVSHYALYPIARAGLMSVASFRRKWAEDMPWIMRGVPVATAESLFGQVVASDLLRLSRPEVLARLAWHREQGHRVVILSGVFEPLLAAYGRATGVEDVIGTQLEARDGRYTGRRIGTLCFGEGKVERLKQRLADANVDWQASYAYGDSQTDLPILQAVGHPVAVSPDDRLKEHARRHDWPVL